MKTKPKPKPKPTSNGRDESGRFRRGQVPKPAPKPPLVVERVGLHTLHEDPSNPNTHPENDIKDLMAKLATFGQVEPLVVQKSSRKVIGGNGRLEAMRRLGWVQCDVTFVDCDNVTATALGISLNRRKSIMDDSALVAQLQAIQSENADLMAAVGYDSGELDALIAGLKKDVTPAEDPGAQVDRAEELLAKWKVKLGDLWVIPSKATPGGEHRILCGDSTKGEDVARVMGGEKADLCLTDPPYGVDLDYGGHDDGDKDAYFKLMSGFMDRAREIADLIILTAGNKHNNYWFKTFEPSAFLIWFDKTKQSPHSAAHLCKSELILIFGKVVERYAWDTFEIEGVRGDGLRELHRCPKPIELFRCLMEPQAARGKIVADPFLGSGTTIVAAEQTGRLCRGIELAPKYVAVTLERLSGMGLNPRLEGKAADSLQAAT